MAFVKIALFGFAACIAVILAQDCVVEENTYEDGSEFHIEEHGKCILYKCNNGGYSPIKKQCLEPSSGECRDIGFKYEERCVNYECKEEEAGIGFFIISQKCEGDDGSCHNENEEFEKTYEGQVFSKTTCTMNATHRFYSFKD